MAAVQKIMAPAVPSAVDDVSMVLDGNKSKMAASPAILQQPGAAIPDSDSRLGVDSKFGSGPQRGDTRIVVIVYGQNQQDVVSVFAEVLGKPFSTRPNFQSITPEDQHRVIGIMAEHAKSTIQARDRNLVVAINAHCVRPAIRPDALLSAESDYEFLYTDTSFFRRDLSRFISFTLGQINHHETLMAKPRTYFMSSTFPDVRSALPNIDILTVGSDAFEIRVDLIKEPLGAGSFAPVPSLSYVGEQVMLLRQHTELPLIFTTRCEREGGRFPTDNPELVYDYLYRAIQWGVEYIDVELWLPETFRRRLYEKRGNSRIMSAFHDFSGNFKWPSSLAQDIFAESCRYADIVKMITITNDRNENFELEYFRSKMRSEYPSAPPFSAVNMGEAGQFSRTQNHVFTPITHPLLPVIAAPGQMSAAEINMALSMLGHLPKKNIYGIVSASRNGASQASFYEKCFNELGLPHNFSIVERQPKGVNTIEACCNQRNFGGAYLNPPISYSSIVTRSAFFASLNDGSGAMLSEAARVIGMVDTIIVRPASSPPASAEVSNPSSPRHYQNDSLSSGSSIGLSKSSSSNNISATNTAGSLPASTSIIFDNASWRGILSTLTRDLAPSAYFGRTAVVMASSSDDAASAIFALKALRISKIYTVGFKTPPSLANNLVIEPFNSLQSLQRARAMGAHDDVASPFVVISALGPDKGNLVGLLVRIFGTNGGRGNLGMPGSLSTFAQSSSWRGPRKVFLDLASGATNGAGYMRKGDPRAVAEQCGFAVLGSADAAAFTIVETLRLLVGQNVPYSFVRLANGQNPF